MTEKILIIGGGIYGMYLSTILNNKDNSIFNKDFCIDLLRKNSQGYNNSEEILGLLIFERWRDHFSIEL